MASAAGRGRRRGRLPPAIAAGLLAAIVVSGALADNRDTAPARLNPDEARATARQAFRLGDHASAAAISAALLQRNPDDLTALIVLAGAQQALGQDATAAAHARRAFRLTRDPNARFDAAMILSRAHYAQGHVMRAQYWLRRSGHVAPSPALKAVAQRDFNYIQAVKPWETRFHFGLAPSSNVNNGSDASVVMLNGLPFVLSGDARALAGVEATTGFGAKRRFRISDRRLATLGFNLLSRNYRLTPAALAVSGGKTGADYAFGAAEIEAALHQGSNSARQAVFVTFGRNWYGGAVLTDYAKVALAGERAVTGGALGLSLSLERQIRADSNQRSATLASAGLSRSFTLPAGHRATLSYSLRNVFSGSTEIAHIAHDLNFGLRLGEPVLGAQMALGLGVNARTDKSPRLAPDPRRDIGFSATITMTLTRFEVMGFSPVIDLNLSRNLSTIDLYDSSRQNLSVGIKSTF
ncbi:MAG: hypothetical protein KDK00_01735 [Rhodobacteraceae bacterium]|nr:hypothetical protein [Paracoccaceae bacterium]